MKLKNAGRAGDGFTLVELITVLVILSVMSAMAIPSLAGFIGSVKEQQYVMEAQGVRRSVELYMVDRFEGGEIDAMVLMDELSSSKMCAREHPLTGYLVAGCTKGASVERLTIDTKRYQVIEMTYSVAGYWIEIEEGKVKVTRPGGGPGGGNSGGMGG